ncbi:CDP-glycerol glycerophosphotransferase family protein [Halobacillus naozhouensis]|uniref:CDP-glycerol glycerophosphotransferase family protein n=1 Tax=Halobacillus naozhouensis TaxID=554880 RepID=A0ABY8IUK6_9BACI|nr:CDP-glycerol glycerophosphotransferase family protein [Halobacillus naozhouensis]WFT73803.1 CDP-glycerol glycerophosphotransferase family protein [Halobacillus naozhouensis]
MKKVVNKIKMNNVVTRMLRLGMRFFSIFPTNSRLIIFESFHGKQFSDNPRAIYEYLSREYKDYTLIWAADRRYINKFKNYDIRFVKRLSLRWLYLMSRAKIWVVNSRMPLWMIKPSRTIYLQTWHGTPLKKLGVDIENVQMPGTDTERYRRNFVYEASKWDYLVSPNLYSTKIFKNAFKYEGRIIETGYPRNDYLYTNNNSEEIFYLKEKLGIPIEKRVILYAPTWRDDQFYEKGRYKFNLQLDLSKMKKELGENYVILLRMHYLVAENIDLSDLGDFVLDVSSYEDIRELYLVSDILITDYSSVFFDYANLKRPMIFFTYDLDDYRDRLRGFYFDFEKEAPGPLLNTTSSIVKEIIKIENNGHQFSEKEKSFYSRFCKLEQGISSKRVMDFLLRD